MKRLSCRALFACAMTLSTLPYDTQACDFRLGPTMCDPIARQTEFWIGEWTGAEYFFRMEIGGNPMTPPRDTTGKLTLFEQNGRLGFSGGGAFSGEAELTETFGDYIDPLDPRWDWVDHVSTLDVFENDGSYNLSDGSDEEQPCGFQSWPRWVGTFTTPDGFEMTLTLIGVGFNTMTGRVYFNGTHQGNKVLLDSRFIIQRSFFDTSGWTSYNLPDSAEICRDDCREGGYYRSSGDRGLVVPGRSDMRNDLPGVVENCPS